MSDSSETTEPSGGENLPKLSKELTKDSDKGSTKDTQYLPQLDESYQQPLVDVGRRTVPQLDKEAQQYGAQGKGGTTKRSSESRSQIFGMRVRTLLLLLLALVIILGVALGVGLGVGLKKSNNKSDSVSGGAAASGSHASSSASASATSSASSSRASASGSGRSGSSSAVSSTRSASSSAISGSSTASRTSSSAAAASSTSVADFGVLAIRSGSPVQYSALSVNGDGYLYFGADTDITTYLDNGSLKILDDDDSIIWVDADTHALRYGSSAPSNSTYVTWAVSDTSLELNGESYATSCGDDYQVYWATDGSDSVCPSGDTAYGVDLMVSYATSTSSSSSSAADSSSITSAASSTTSSADSSSYTPATETGAITPNITLAATSDSLTIDGQNVVTLHEGAGISYAFISLDNGVTTYGYESNNGTIRTLDGTSGIYYYFKIVDGILQAQLSYGSDATVFGTADDYSTLTVNGSYAGFYACQNTSDPYDYSNNDINYQISYFSDTSNVSDDCTAMNLTFNYV
ncbi:hypothetical protein BZA70DRAFT_199743 [Myxozyma melibiosi]|uniref:Uncharacterized protein n=1 Tax=Myxozyma melibiosi TaxID=54550 RepID=A0ABR1F4P8_9ASCO